MTVFWPSPPTRVSLPAPPSSLSSPDPPARKLSCALPVIESLPAPPMMCCTCSSVSTSTSCPTRASSTWRYWTFSVRLP
ncbi:Uncharacterised protein [Bordetella pertussis]|nr:Uncharacterised protein [Bordetella pertussis]